MTLPRELHWRDGGIAQTLALEADRASTWPRAKILSTLSFPASPWEIVVPTTEKSWRLEATQNRVLIFSLSRHAEDGNWYFLRGPASFPSDWADKKESLASIFTFPAEVPFDNEPAGTRIIVDACSVEAFCDGGRVYFSAQIFPPGGEWQIELLPV
jgi:sucrose-6-phosphate hydrolase SacC (GH32 family)